MTLGEQARYWGIGIAVFAVAVWFLSGILLPFVLGAAVAYLCDPLADRLEKRGVSRIWATIIISVLGMGVAVLALLVVIPLVVEQVRQAISGAPAVLDHLLALTEQWKAEDGWVAQVLRESAEKLRENAADWSASLLKTAWSSGLAVIDFLLLLFVTPVVAFYLLLDWDRMIAEIDDWLPRQHRSTIHRLAGELDKVMSGFVRGQLTVCAILGTFYAVALTLIGLPFGLLIGLFAGLLTFIPYVGVIIGGLLSIGLALVHFWGDWGFVLGVAAIFAVGQVVEGNYLTPKLVGGSVGLHPVWLMFALSAFGALFGFTGLLIAVPAAAAIGVLGRFGLSQYKSGRLYRGSDAGRFHVDAPKERGEKGPGA